MLVMDVMVWNVAGAQIPLLSASLLILFLRSLFSFPHDLMLDEIFESAGSWWR